MYVNECNLHITGGAVCACIEMLYELHKIEEERRKKKNREDIETEKKKKRERERERGRERGRERESVLNSKKEEEGERADYRSFFLED